MTPDTIELALLQACEHGICESNSEFDSELHAFINNRYGNNDVEVGIERTDEKQKTDKLTVRMNDDVFVITAQRSQSQL